MEERVFPIITDKVNSLPLYITSIGECGFEDIIDRPNGHPEYQWVHTIKGTGWLMVDDKEYIIKENTGFFIHPNIPHCFHKLSSSWNIRCVTFNGTIASELIDKFGIDKFRIFDIEDLRSFNSLIDQMILILKSNHTRKNVKASSLLYQFITEIRLLIYKEETVNEVINLKPVIKYIEDNYPKEITLNELSKTIGKTPQHLCRLFKRAYYVTPFEYINSFRIQKAKHMLVRRSEEPLRAICNNCGFNDSSYFSSTFKRHTNLTPLEFRRMHKSK